MLTPQFKITQSSQQVIVVIRLPYVKITMCQFYIESYNFKFYLKPYLLSLQFQQQLQEAQQPSKATYYHEKHLLQVYLNKKNKGQNFQNLNLLSKILNKKKQKPSNSLKKVLVEPVQQSSVLIVGDNHQNLSDPYSYGFCNNYTNVFKNLQQESYQLFSINPENVAISDRYQFSTQVTQSLFDQDAYLYDKYQNLQEIQQIVNNKQITQQINKMLSKYQSKQPQTYQQFKSNLKIPNKQIIVKNSDEQNIIKQLLSLSFCFIYQLICMQGQMSVESAKTINNCSAVLSCCIDYSSQSIQEVLKDSSKRCLTYSLYKHIKICLKTVKILSKCLQQSFINAFLANLRAMFQKSQPRYLLNTIYINDYIIYCQKSNLNEKLRVLREQILNKFTLSEDDLKIYPQQQQQNSQDSDKKQVQVNEKKIQQIDKNKQKQDEIK